MATGRGNVSMINRGSPSAPIFAQHGGVWGGSPEMMQGTDAMTRMLQQMQMMRMLQEMNQRSGNSMGNGQGFAQIGRMMGGGGKGGGNMAAGLGPALTGGRGFVG